MPSDKIPPPLRRDIEALPIEHEGQPMYLLQDPEGLCPHAMAISPAGMMVASLLDGRRTADEIQAVLRKASGAVIETAKIQGIVAELEKAKLLETPEVGAELRRILEEFKKSPKRPAMITGSGYPAPTLELAAFMGQFFRAAKGPGKPLADKPSRLAPPLGLVSPHIDLHRGGPAYAWAYGALAEGPPPDVVVALGVAHASPNSPWTMTSKAYETPYGPVEVDKELYDTVKAELWYDPLDDEWVHRREHSLEFQALWLKFLWRDKTPPWVPILCSSFERFCPDKPPSTVPTVEKAIAAIGSRLASLGKKRRIMILAGVDLAHVGPRFGDDMALGPETEKKIEAEDQVSIEKALALEADAFYLSVVKDGHWRKVCGLSALYTSLRWIRALGASTGRLLTYGQAPDPAGGIVSFTSLEFPPP